ncbi:MAG: Uncharacterized protein H6Q14_1145 [Bacteroidetes bacterium]|jgi:hypothetical protein|nr:Uncharacterized protein [Bacteroidota bacterium]
MRIKDKLILRHVGNDYIIIEPERDTVDMTKVFSLNESAVWLWEELNGIDFTEEYMAELLMKKYDVSKERALEDVYKLITIFKDQGLICK